MDRGKKWHGIKPGTNLYREYAWGQDAKPEIIHAGKAWVFVKGFFGPRRFDRDKPLLICQYKLKGQ